jgi:CubicO group peptidase (beta-lactamase class C family)
MIDNTDRGGSRCPPAGKATTMPASTCTRPDAMTARFGGSSTARWLVAAAVSLLVVAVAALPAAAASPDRGTLARMDRVIRDGMDGSGLPGFAVVVVSGDDAVHARGFGDAGDGRRVTPRTPFLLGSTSKSFTALAAMQLVDAGKLDLDAPARRYVPEFRLADQRAADRITVRQALQQTTGMPATAGGPIVRSAADGTALEALHELRDVKLVTPPGEAFAYSNGNYVLAGLIVERASGEPYAQYVQRHIFTPLGMRDSYVALDAAKRAGLATGHRYWFGLAAAHGPTFRAGIQSAGYLMSSGQDMGRYLAMFLSHGVTADGERVVSRHGLETMLTPGRPGKLGAWSDHADARYAMGWFVGGPWSEPAQLHPGRAPDSSALIAMFPRRDLAVVTLTNAANDLTLPGYPAAVDRVERNAIDALIGDPVDAGTSLHRYYLYVDLIALALLAAAAWALVRAARALRTRTRPRHRWRAIAGVATRAAGGLLLVALPALAFGWRASFLWQPDVFTVVVLLGALLLVTAALRLATLVRRSPESAPREPVFKTPPGQTAPPPALIARMTRRHAAGPEQRTSP